MLRAFVPVPQHRTWFPSSALITTELVDLCDLGPLGHPGATVIRCAYASS